MDELIKALKFRWLVILELGLFVSGIVLVIIIPPPFQESNTKLIKFFITILVGFTIIPIFLYNLSKYFKHWLLATIIASFFCILVNVTYSLISEKYIIEYAGEQIVIGDEFTPEALKAIKHINLEERITINDSTKENNLELLKYVGGNASKIWNQIGINKNKTIIISLFYFNVSFFTILILCLVHTLQILLSKAV